MVLHCNLLKALMELTILQIKNTIQFSAYSTILKCSLKAISTDIIITHTVAQ